MSLRGILLQSKCYFINYDLIKSVGTDASFFFAILLDIYKNIEEKNQLFSYKGKDGLFCVTIEDMEKISNFKAKKQKNIVDLLKNKKLIDQINLGLPSKRYFKITNRQLIKTFYDACEEADVIRLEYQQLLAERAKQEESKGQNSDLEKTSTPYINTSKPYITNMSTSPKEVNIRNKYISRTTAQSDKKCAKSASTHATSSIRAVHNLNFNFSSGLFEGITPEDLETWKKLYDKVSVDRELVKMQEWVKSNPTKIKKLWRRFITGWLNRAQEREYNRGSYHSTAKDRERSQFEMRHVFENTDRSPQNPKRKLDFSDWKPEDDYPKGAAK